ncbi:DUF1792 domain-containing protein [Acinetobacter defluvii]|uniref:DUF1792 domain-containing protein n=1 Tax=Acinetobacter defluvii TaxID=1871111 RepID=A0A2S2F9F8_9GAMM|nr:GT-D fold domain-containing glycosyltransferase [Acinetobacter defluvii]AWL27611.1 DUF1792 domain-containing protein [Acinetobacter defluvii]
MLLNDLLNELKEKFLYMQYVERVEIYKNQVVYIDIKTENLFFALDVNQQYEIFLVCRNPETQRFLSQYFQCFIDFRLKIYAKNKTLVSFLNIEYTPDIDKVIEKILKQLLAYTQNQNYLLNTLNDQVIQLNKQFKATQMNEIYLDMANTLSDKFLSIRETLIQIKEKELSLARFGDGEIRCMVTTGGCVFQKHDWKLMQELRDISRNDMGIMVCYPSLLIEDSFWNKFWLEFWAKCKFYLKHPQLGDAMITRPEAFYFYGNEIVDLWKTIWEGKKVCFITGKNSRLNAAHTIFSNITCASYIYSKNQDAYAEIDDVMKQCIEQKQVDLFLIALGPTGTVLAARLHHRGFRALDIGHLNNSYDTVFLNQMRPEQITYLASDSIPK